MIVVCSAQALVRDGVLKELEEQIDEDPNKIIPISVDKLWMAKGIAVRRGERDLKPFLLERNYLDLNSKNIKTKMNRLLKALELKKARR